MDRIRKIEDESEARRCLRAAERAGQRAGEWARAHGVDGRSLHAWELNLARVRPAMSQRKKERPSGVVHDLVELVPSSAGQSACGGYVVEIGDARVKFGDDVSAATLRRVLEALRGC